MFQKWIDTFDIEGDLYFNRQLENARPADDKEIGTCQGCGSYGWQGDTCIRKIDGRMEECGEYL